MRSYGKIPSYNYTPDVVMGMDWDIFLAISDLQEDYLADARRVAAQKK